MRRIISIIVPLAFLSADVSFADTLRLPLTFSNRDHIISQSWIDSSGDRAAAFQIALRIKTLMTQGKASSFIRSEILRRHGMSLQFKGTVIYDVATACFYLKYRDDYLKITKEDIEVSSMNEFDSATSPESVPELASGETFFKTRILDDDGQIYDLEVGVYGNRIVCSKRLPDSLSPEAFLGFHLDELAEIAELQNLTKDTAIQSIFFKELANRIVLQGATTVRFTKDSVIFTSVIDGQKKIVTISFSYTPIRKEGNEEEESDLLEDEEGALSVGLAVSDLEVENLRLIVDDGTRIYTKGTIYPLRGKESIRSWLGDSISAMAEQHLKGLVDVQQILASGESVLVPEEIVRPAELSDLPEMMALRKTYFFDEVIQDVKGSIFHLDELDEKANADAVLHHCERIIRGHAPGSVMVARWRGEIIGYAIGWVPAVSAIEFGELAEMAVHKDYRRRGIAKALIKRVVTDMRSFATFSRINLHDFTKGEEKGSISRILEGLGFQSIEFGSYVLTLGKEESRLNSVLARVREKFPVSRYGWAGVLRDPMSSIRFDVQEISGHDFYRPTIVMGLFNGYEGISYDCLDCAYALQQEFEREGFEARVMKGEVPLWGTDFFVQARIDGEWQDVTLTPGVDIKEMRLAKPFDAKGAVYKRLSEGISGVNVSYPWSYEEKDGSAVLSVGGIGIEQVGVSGYRTGEILDRVLLPEDNFELRMTVRLLKKGENVKEVHLVFRCTIGELPELKDRMLSVSPDEALAMLDLQEASTVINSEAIIDADEDMLRQAIEGNKDIFYNILTKLEIGWLATKGVGGRVGSVSAGEYRFSL